MYVYLPMFEIDTHCRGSEMPTTKIMRYLVCNGNCRADASTCLASAAIPTKKPTANETLHLAC